MEKNSHHHHGHSHNHFGDGNLNIKAGLLAVSMASFLVLIKIYAWVQTDSLSIFSSLIDSSFDVLISLINFLAIRYAVKPADSDHPYGHTSIEDIVGLLQAAFISGSGFFICYEALQRFFQPVVVKETYAGIIVMGVSVAFTTALVIYQKIVVSKTRSLVVASDSVHYLSDILTGGLVMVSLLLAGVPGIEFIDPLIGCAIAVYISAGAIKIGRRAFNNLMDREIDEVDKKRIQEIIKAEPRVKGFHQFKTRCSGNKIFVQFDIELDNNLSLQAAHDISDEVMFAIEKEFPESEVVIHLDPV